MFRIVARLDRHVLSFLCTSIPSGHDVFAIAGDSDDYPSAGLGGGPVGDFGVKLTVLELVAVQVNVNDEIVDAVQIDVRVGNDEAFRRLDLPFA